MTWLEWALPTPRAERAFTSKLHGMYGATGNTAERALAGRFTDGEYVLVGVGEYGFTTAWAETEYPTIGDPPSFAGGCQVTTPSPAPGVTDTATGGPGAPLS